MASGRSIPEREHARATLLRKIYETAGSSGRFVSLNAVAGEMTAEDLDDAVSFLLNEKLIEISGPNRHGRLATVTYAGAKEAERLVESPGQPTAHFPASVTQNFYAPVGAVQMGADSTANVHQSPQDLPSQPAPTRGAGCMPIVIVTITSFATVLVALFTSGNLRLPLWLASTPQPATITTTFTSGEKVSGSMKNFSDWYELCSEPAPPGYRVEGAQFQLSGDRRCGGWAECTETRHNESIVCWRFRLQGHDEWPWPGQAKSEGTLTVTYCRKSDPGTASGATPTSATTLSAPPQHTAPPPAAGAKEGMFEDAKGELILDTRPGSDGYTERCRIERKGTPLGCKADGFFRVPERHGDGEIVYLLCACSKR